MDRFNKTPRGGGMETEAAWRRQGPSRRTPRASYHGQGRSASRSRMLLTVDGKPGGLLVTGDTGTELVKRASARFHQLRVPRGWACDVGVLRQAEEGGAVRVRIHDTDSGREYVAALTAFREHGFPVRRGFGEQRGLELTFWRLEDPAQPQLLVEVLA